MDQAYAIAPATSDMTKIMPTSHLLQPRFGLDAHVELWGCVVKPSQIETAWKGRADCRACGVRALVLFADLQEQDFDLIHKPIEEIHIEVGQRLYHANTPGRSLFTLRSGLIKLVHLGADGSQRIVRLLRPGATAGLEVLVGSEYAHDAIALQPVTACRIPCEVVDKLSRETPRLHTQLMQRWHDSLRQADDFLTELSTGRATKRLGRLLLQLAEPDGSVILPTREDMGAMLGMTLEHASRTVSELKRLDAIFEISGNRYRCDLEALSCISATPR